MPSNKLSVEIVDDELRQKLSEVNPGDEVELTVHATLDEVAADKATFSVKDAAIVENESEEEGDSEEEESNEASDAGESEKESMPAGALAMMNPPGGGGR